MTKKRDTPLERAAMRWYAARAKDYKSMALLVCAYKASNKILLKACAAHQKRKGK